MRTKTQTLSVFAEDLNAFHVSSTDTSAPHADLAIDGADGSIVTDVNGVKSIDLVSSSKFVPLLNFTTGATGSVATVTITGEDLTGGVLTETVVMPGAAANVSATKLFRKITQMSIDGDYTNLEVGVRNEVDQFGKWLIFDTYKTPFEVYLDLNEVTNGSTLTIELTSDPALFVSPIDANAMEVYNASTSPFAAGITASQDGNIGADGPFLAARLRHTAGTAGKWRARFVQSGGRQ